MLHLWSIIIVMNIRKKRNYDGVMIHEYMERSEKREMRECCYICESVERNVCELQNAVWASNCFAADFQKNTCIINLDSS
jgi:hypothetical protein